MLAAVLPFALERGLLPIADGRTTARVLTLNTGMQCDVTVQTPAAACSTRATRASTACPAPPRRSASTSSTRPVRSALAAAERPVLDRVRDGPGDPFEIDATLIDNGMPMVLVRAADLGVSGYEGVAELNANAALKAKAGSPAPGRRPADGPGRREAQELPEDVPGRAAARRRQHRHPLLHSACLP
jgi:4-oxalomesaconate tautomerase